MVVLSQLTFNAHFEEQFLHEDKFYIQQNRRHFQHVGGRVATFFCGGILYIDEAKCALYMVYLDSM